MSKKARYARYLILLLILFAVAAYQAFQKARVASWDNTLRVGIYSVNADSSRATNDYINSLQLKHFKTISRFINQEANRHGLNGQAIEIEYLGELTNRPPQPPSGNSILENILWSLHFRGWALYWSINASGHSPDTGPPDVNLFVNYYDAATTYSLRHSVGLEGGMIGLINAFASHDYNGSNNTVITHELMHTLGAKDKYGQGNMPEHPRGYAEPWRDPLYPQVNAEIMGGRIPITASQAKMPESLSEVLINIYTAAEINWVEE